MPSEPETTVWETEFNEHVNYQPPYITAEYRRPVGMEGETPLRLRPVGDESGYGFEVSAPDESGQVTLAAIRTDEQALTETVPLKSYDGTEPRRSALHDARGLVYEWGQHDLTHALGSALQLAQETDATRTQLFEQVDLPPDARPLAAIQAEREAEHEAELTENHPHRLDYHREVGDLAYDFPLEAGQGYAFRSRALPTLEAEVARYGVDALALETVKHWQADGQTRSEAVTLDILFDRDEAYAEVDTYVELAEREGIQAAMTRAATLAKAHTQPDMQTRAAELDLHLNPDVRYGAMFQTGPADPFLSEREIDQAAVLFRAEEPLEHKLSLEVVAVQDHSTQPLGFAVLALDATYEPATDQRLGLAEGVAVYELAHFKARDEAATYTAQLSEYMDKRDLSPSGTDIRPTLQFLQGVGENNGFSPQARWLLPREAVALTGGETALHHPAEDFHPLIETPMERER